ncbi:MAG: DUF1570 domain-containing protein [Myxococcota bacterium]
MHRRLTYLLLLFGALFVYWDDAIEFIGLVKSESSAERRAEGESTPTGMDVEREPTDLERAVQRSLETQARNALPPDRVVKADGRVLRGRVLSETSTGIRILRSFGNSGQMEMTIPRSEIREVARNANPAPQISFRDVRFKLEFPNLNFYRRPPFTIMTDQDFFKVEHAVRTLEELHFEFTRSFEPLITQTERKDGIQILIFSDERLFVAYRDEYAPEVSYASGFYSRIKNRLVIFDQVNSEWSERAKQEIDSVRPNRLFAESAGHRAALDRWQTTAKSLVRAEAGRVNRAVLRHEGAHQLFFTYGVHSERGAEPLWLIEGLAGFWEFGANGANPARSDELKRAGSLLRGAGLRTFVNAAAGEGFSALDDDAFVGFAYAQSWFIVRHLIRNHREGFFEYIRFVRDTDGRSDLPAPGATPHFEQLSRFVGLSPDELERDMVRGFQRL